MRYVDDLVVYAVPRRRVVYDYGYAVDDAELARVEDAARYMSNQTIDDVHHIRDVSRRSDQIALERANRLIQENSQVNQPFPTAHLRAHRYPVATDMVIRDQARSLNDRLRRSMSVSAIEDEPVPIYHPLPRRRHVPVGSAVPASSLPRYIPPPRYVTKRQDLVNYRRVYASPTVQMPAPVSEHRRRLERKLDTELLDYEMPRPEAYSGIREHLRGVNDKLLAHRLLLDRYSGIEMAHPQSVEQSVESKYSELIARMPTLNRGSQRK